MQHLPWAYTWIQAQILPYSAQPQRRCSRSPAELGGEFQGYENQLCLHGNKSTSPKDQLSILIKEHVWRTSSIRRAVLGGTCPNPNTTARACGRRWPWIKQDPPACFRIPAGQSAKLNRLQKDKTTNKPVKNLLLVYHLSRSLPLPFRWSKEHKHH